MVFKKDNNGRWILKKKFTFAATVLTAINLMTFKGIMIATTVADVSVLLTAYATASGVVLTLIFAADVVDKKLNSGTYESR